MSTSFPSCYDAVINWKKRLAREMPLLEELARQAGGRVLVAACGTGGHVVALAQQGFNVLGFDADAGMVEFTRRRIEAAAPAIAAAHGKAEVRLLALEGAAHLHAEFAAAFCLGNALPGLSAEGQLLAALRGVASALGPGGIFLTQNLNYDLRWQQRISQFPLLDRRDSPRRDPAGEGRGVSRGLHQLPRHVSDARKALGKMASPHPAHPGKFLSSKNSSRTSRRRPAWASSAFWGDFARTPFAAEGSHDLIFAARKQDARVARVVGSRDPAIH